MAVQFASESGIVNPIKHKGLRGSNGTAPVGPMSFAVIAGGGGSRRATGGAGGFRKSFSTELSGGGAPSESPLVFGAAQDVQVTIGAGGSGASTNNSNVGAASNGTPSSLGPITSLGGGFGADGGPPGGNSNTGPTPSKPLTAANSGGSGGGGRPGFSTDNAGSAGGAGAAGQGFAGTSGGNGGSSGGSATFGSAGSGGGAGGSNGAGLATLIRGSSETFAASVSTAGPNTGNRGQSGIVIVRYPEMYTITIGAGLTGTTTTVGQDKVTTFTAGTGNVSWIY